MLRLEASIWFVKRCDQVVFLHSDCGCRCRTGSFMDTEWAGGSCIDVGVRGQNGCRGSASHISLQDFSWLPWSTCSANPAWPRIWLRRFLQLPPLGCPPCCTPVRHGDLVETWREADSLWQHYSAVDKNKWTQNPLDVMHPLLLWVALGEG